MTRSVFLPDDVLTLIFEHLVILQPVQRRCEHKHATKKSSATLLITTNNASFLSCSLVSRKWYYPAVKCMWKVLMINSNSHAHKISTLLKTNRADNDAPFKFYNFVHVVDTISAVNNGEHLDIPLLSAILKLLPKLQQLRVCRLPDIPSEFFATLHIICPFIRYLDACNCRSLQGSHVERLTNDWIQPDVIGSTILSKVRPIFVSSISEGLFCIEPTISAFITRFLLRKRKLIWTEISSFHLTTYKQARPILKKLVNLEEIYICSDLHLHDDFRQNSNLFCLSEALAISILTKNLRIIDLRHNLETLTDKFLESLKEDSPNIRTLRLPSHNKISDVGLHYLISSPCISKLTTFAFENGIIWRSRPARSRPVPSFTQNGLSELIFAMASLEILILDLPKNVEVSSDILDTFTRLDKLTELRLAGTRLVDGNLLTRLSQMQSSMLVTLDLESPSFFDTAKINKIIQKIGRKLRELRLCCMNYDTKNLSIPAMLVKSKDDSLLFNLAKYAPVISSLCIFDGSFSLSPLGLMALIEQCAHLTYLQLENTVRWTSEELSQFLTLVMREPRKVVQSVLGFQSPSSFNKKRQGGLCLQYFSIAVDSGLDMTVFFPLAKMRFPSLKTFR